MLLQKYDDEGLGNGSEIWTEKMGDRLNGQGLGGGSFFYRNLCTVDFLGGGCVFLQEPMYRRLFI